MHETAIVESLLEQVDRFVPDEGRIDAVHLEVGQLEHLDGDVMQSAWTAITDDTSMAGSTLLIERVPLHVRCRACAHEYEPEDLAFLMCPKCHAVQPQVLSGSGVLLRSIDVMQPDDESETPR
jgi:hydrogenase nickel incorporation protein HypA/HybF